MWLCKTPLTGVKVKPCHPALLLLEQAISIHNYIPSSHSSRFTYTAIYITPINNTKMKKFGLGKKDKSEKPTIESSAPTGTAVASEDSSRSRLFGSRNKAKPASPAPANPNSNPYAVSNASSGGNPYANAPAPGLSVNPYASGGNGAQKNGQQDPYLQNSRGAPSGYGNPSRGNGYDNRDLDRTQSSATAPPAYDANPSGPTYRDTKSQPQPQSQTQNNNYSGYNNTGSYNKQAGYGDDRYSEASSIATTRVGGYGGFGGGRNDSRETLDTDAGKAALFGNARERLQQRQAETQLPPEEDPAQGGAYGGSSGGGYGESQGYGAHYDSQLTVRFPLFHPPQHSSQLPSRVSSQELTAPTGRRTRRSRRRRHKIRNKGPKTRRRLPVAQRVTNRATSRRNRPRNPRTPGNPRRNDSQRGKKPRPLRQPKPNRRRKEKGDCEIE